MDEGSIADLRRDIEDLKKAVKRNDPLLREIAAPPGWAAFSAAAGLTVTLFALPAHFLIAEYGSFAAIPALYQALLIADLLLFTIVGSGLTLVIMHRRVKVLEEKDGLSRAFMTIYGGPTAHLMVPLTLGIVAGSAFAVYYGHPWLALPITSFFFGIMSNGIAARSGIAAYYAIGYWGIVVGLAAVPFVESAPYFWLFLAYGGMFFVFGAVLWLTNAVRAKAAAK